MAVLVPVKDFRQAKVRLAGALEPPARAALARHMAANVLAAAKGLPTFVVCDDDDVANFATELGAEVLWRPGLGLNGAVADGVQALAGRPASGASSWPTPTYRSPSTSCGSHGWTGSRSSPTATTTAPTSPASRRTVGFRFAYGPGSFRRHAVRRPPPRPLGRASCANPRLGWDVDVPDDLSHPSLQGVLPSLPTSPANPA